MSVLVEVFRESIRMAWSQKVFSALTILIVAAMALIVSVTSGRTVAAEQQILGSIDLAGTRSIVVSGGPESGLMSGALDRLSTIDGIEWAGAFSAAEDASNTLIPGGERVGARFAYTNDFQQLGLPAMLPPFPAAYGDEEALMRLGLVDAVGSITLTGGTAYAVVGGISPPDDLTAADPQLLVPVLNRSGDEPVTVIIVIADRPNLVLPLTSVVQSVLGPEDPASIKVETSQAFADLRGLVEGQISSFSRSLVLALLGISAVLVAFVLYGLVLLRRRDFGRRRALGASRMLIVVLLLSQTALLAFVGVVLGVSTALIISLVSNSPTPGIAFTVAVSVLSILAATAGSLVPAVVASRREPIRELRVP